MSHLYERVALQLKEQIERTNETMFGYYNAEQESVSAALQRIAWEHGEALKTLREKNSERRVNLPAAVQHALDQKQEAAEMTNTLETKLKEAKGQLGQAHFGRRVSHSDDFRESGKQRVFPGGMTRAIAAPSFHCFGVGSAAGGDPVEEFHR